MKVNFFKLNKNRKFNYTPRFYKGKDDVAPSFESKFSVYRESYTQTISESIGLIKGIKCVIEKTGVLI